MGFAGHLVCMKGWGMVGEGPKCGDPTTAKLAQRRGNGQRMEPGRWGHKETSWNQPSSGNGNQQRVVAAGGGAAAGIRTV
jgi:hypothetical protein